MTMYPPLAMLGKLPGSTLAVALTGSFLLAVLAFRLTSIGRNTSASS
jgi:hypothetical protein